MTPHATLTKTGCPAALATPDVSFVVVSWNAKAFLLSCLASIVETVGDYPYEIIVVDNDSSDGSPMAVEERFPQAQVVRTGGNLGFAAGTNRGIAASRGRWLCLVNSDVVLLPGCIDSLVHLMKNEPDVGLAAPRILNVDHTLQRSCRRFPTLWRSFCSAVGLDSIVPRSQMFGGTLMTWWQYDTQRDVDVVSGCVWFVLRDAMQDTGGLDETFFMYGEDIDWCRRLSRGKWRTVFTPAGEAIHYGGGSSKNSPLRFFIAMQEAELRYWRKHHGAVATMARAGIIFLHQSVRIVARSVTRSCRFLRSEDDDFKIARSVACVRWLLAGARSGFDCARGPLPHFHERPKHVSG